MITFVLPCYPLLVTLNITIQQTYYNLQTIYKIYKMPRTQPKRVQQYQVLQILGKGGNGVVYKGIDMLKGTFVALKEIIIEKTEVKSLKFEINVLKELSDPFIVKYIDAIQVQNRIYLILQYLQGGSLGSLVQKTPLDQKLVKKYIKQVLKGLQYLHKHHVAHRDLKGTNILLTKEGKAKITDFGVAIQVNDTQITLSSAGTPYWMAPEAIINESTISVECDIWSLGCTVIQLLTGNPPYHSLMPYPALFRIVQDEHPPLPENLSVLCKDFLMRCFCKQPKKRAKAGELLKHKWIKQFNQHKSSSFSVDIANIVFENDQKIEGLIKNQDWQELHTVALTTTNKKTIYYHKHFITLAHTPNNDSKLKLVRELTAHNFEALKYLSTIRVYRALFQQELQEGFQITKLKLIDFLFETYQLCEENNDLLIFLNDGFLEILAGLLVYMSGRPKEWQKRIVHLAKCTELIFRLTSSGLLIQEHLHNILQSQGVFEELLKVAEFIFSLKNAEMSFNTICIFRKHLEYSQSSSLYAESLQNFCRISQHFYDFRVLFQFISFIKRLLNQEALNNLKEEEKIWKILLPETVRTLQRLGKLQTVTMEEHEILLQLVEFLTIFFTRRQQIIGEFVKLGGLNLLTSLPESYTKDQKIYGAITGLVEVMDQ